MEIETVEMKAIISSVDTLWPKDYIIRFLYIKLAPFFQRDLKYFLATDEEKYQQFSQGFINRGRNIVCSTLADYYVGLYARFGIKAKKIAANSTRIPLFAVIVEGDTGYFYINPLNDLFNNQYNLRTTEFGVVPHYKTLNNNYPFLHSLKSDYLNQIDNDLNLPETADNFFKTLHLKMTNRNFIRNNFNVEDNEKEKIFEHKMIFSSNELINLGKVSGAFERIKMYLFIEKIIFFKQEKKNLKIWLNKKYELPRPNIEYTNFSTGNSVAFEEVEEKGKYVLKRLC